MVVLASIVALACGAPQRGSSRPVADAAGRPPWGLVLGGRGGSTAEAVVEGATPPCLTFDDRATLESTAQGLRSELVRRIGLDLNRRVRSVQRQRTVQRGDADISVLRFEVHDGVYMPANLYLPRRRHARVPIVVAPLGCGWGCGSPEPQALAGNLADMGMAVLVAEGFCHNGARAAIHDADPRVGYARKLLGLSSTTAVFLQELVSALSWAIETHAFIDPDRVGVAGHSYGGAIAQLLAQADERVRSLSVPATSIGSPCDAPAFAVSDIHLQKNGSNDVLWSAPLDVPLSPRNAHLVMLYPRRLHTTAGARDTAAPPAVVGGAMEYAGNLWGLAGLRERLLFRTDDGDHNYGRSRREDTYEWFARSLLGKALGRRTERSLPLLPSALLEPDITGTGTLADEMRTVAMTERARRFAGSAPSPKARTHAAAAARRLFGRRLEHLRSETVWRGRFAGIRAQAIRLRGTTVDVPVVELQGKGPRGTGTLLFLPEGGTVAALDLLRERAQRYETVVSADYLGIGELASDRMLLHTLAWSLMQAEDSLPTLNVALLRGVLRQIGSGPVDVEGQGWAPSLYAGALRALEPDRVRRVIVTGVPVDELRRLRRGRRVPDLLLHPGLFLHMTAAELAD
jgi:dienelactone hydrolase